MAILPVWIGLPAVAWPPPGSLTTQAGNSARGVAQSADEELSLELGKPIERGLSGGQSHFYKITMTSGGYLKVTVVQRGADVLVALFAPDGKKIGEVDRAPMTVGSETMSVIAASPGAYRVEARSAGKIGDAGRYEIKLEALREATANDKYLVAAESVFREAEQLENGTVEAKRKSIEKYHEALELYRRVGDQKAVGQTINNIGGIYFYLGERRRALEKFNEALPIRNASGDRRGEAETLSNIGATYDSLGELQKALEMYSKALPILRAVGDRKVEAITHNNIGKVYWGLGETRKAMEKCNEALLIYRNIGDRDGEAGTLTNIGTLHDVLGEAHEALDKFNEALPMLRAAGNRRQEAITLNNIGATLSSLGEYRKALDNFAEALLIRQAIGDRDGEATTLDNIGATYSSLGEMQKALDKHKEALQIMRAIGERNGEAISLNNMGMVYQLIGEPEKALEKYNESMPIRRAVGDPSGEAVTLNNIGAAHQSLGNIRKALEKFNEAKLKYQAAGDRKGEAIILNSIGSAYLALGEARKALEKYKEALPISRAVGERSREAAILHNIGRAYLSVGLIERALESFDEAYNIRRATGDRYGEADTLLWIARVEQKQGRLPQARQSVEQAMDIVESRRADFRLKDLRTAYFASRREYYESYIDILMGQHKQSPAAGFDGAAFAVSERARARSLLELLTESRIDVRQGVDSSLVERERSLQRLLNAKAAAQFTLLNRKHTTTQAEAAAKEIASITIEYEEIRAQIRGRSPRYADLTQPQPLSLEEIQQQVLDPDTLLLEYSLGDNASYLFVVSQTSITSHPLPKRAEIETATRRVRELLTAPQPQSGDTDAKLQARINKARANYWPQAAALSRILLGPAASQLGGKRLLIVADGALQYLPFGALPAPRSLLTAPLITGHEIVHLPSASTLAVLRRELAGRKPAAKTVAVLADPVFSADDARVKSGAETQAGEEAAPDLTRALNDVRGELGRLLLTRNEAEAILSVTPRTEGFGALDFRANRATATGDELGRYRIVHFATHGLLNSEHPELSGVVLSLVDERGQPQDGFLRLHEIFNLRLPAELVVLSACQTGLGKEVKGEGLVGLTRGFMYAGAARVVASLWRVDDAATAELMKRFYRRMLKDGMRPAAALRAAQIEMWEKPQWRSPFYWGGFTLQGEWK